MTPGPTTWLVTGGAGYIGSHVVRALLAAGERVVVLDDLSTGVGARVPAGVPLVAGSVLDRARLERTLREHEVGGVVHLAGKKSVEESFRLPLHYYDENVTGVATLVRAMAAAGVRRLVYSSSAAVYGMPPGDAADVRVDETSPTAPQNPYGRSKLAGEWIVADAALGLGLGAVSLRYFNVVGAADPALAELRGSNLFPRVVAALVAGERPVVHGTDYPTPDGSCVRDYVHVTDVAAAHAAAVALTLRSGHEVLNLGRGSGASVLEVLAQFAQVSGRPVDPVLAPRRPGDPAAVVADAARAGALLGWKATADLPEMVASAWAVATA